MIPFVPAPAPSEVPARFPSPFAADVHPLARRAASELIRELEGGLAERLRLGAPDGGKMFGVLVVADGDGRIGYVCAFSGMVGGSWQIDGFAPPVFDAGARDAFWPDGERELARIDAEIAELAAAAAPANAALVEIDRRHATELDEMRARHRERRRARHAARAELCGGEALAGDADGAALDRESRGDTAERRRLDAGHAAEHEPIAAEVAARTRELAALEARRAARSRELLHQIHATYRLASATGHTRALSELFGPAEPPGGAGDCAAPKLLALAYRRGLRPLALAELWWGAPPATGDRRSGMFYPPCRGKCGPILAHMLDGLAAEPMPVFGATRIAADEPRTIYEDEWLAVVVKPVGLLSVPGRGAALRDSVLARLRERYPTATGALLVHRLDLDTSGLLLCAKDSATHAALQAQFARREIVKRYAAWLDGIVERDGGAIDLPLRGDVDDRPRQIHDPIHGKPAVTEWRVVARDGARTRVELVPRTGRTHQLRVHASHPRGIGVAIVGDRLYGTAGDRLLLHAEHLRFVHPHTHELVTIDDAPPF